MNVDDVVYLNLQVNYVRKIGCWVYQKGMKYGAIYVVKATI